MIRLRLPVWFSTDHLRPSTSSVLGGALAEAAALLVAAAVVRNILYASQQMLHLLVPRSTQLQQVAAMHGEIADIGRPLLPLPPIFFLSSLPPSPRDTCPLPTHLLSLPPACSPHLLLHPLLLRGVQKWQLVYMCITKKKKPIGTEASLM